MTALERRIEAVKKRIFVTEFKLYKLQVYLKELQAEDRKVKEKII